MEYRILHYSEDNDMLATHLYAQPNVVSGKHQHQGLSIAYTLSGRWGHDHNYEYHEGTYIVEPVGVIHQFFSGPAVVEGFFVSYGESSWIDEETGEIGGSFGVRALVDNYFTRCEEQGLPRPNILRV
jgi:hypothetical protein